MKFDFKRTWAVLVLVVFSLPACALNIRYGEFFTVPGVRIEQGRPVLPLSRKKYANVRILDEETYRWLAACPGEECVQPGAQGKTEISSLRAAKTRPGMWIALVEVDKRWLLTFLIFQNTDGYGIVFPDSVLFTNLDFKTSLEQQLTEAMFREKEEETHEM